MNGIKIVGKELNGEDQNLKLDGHFASERRSKENKFASTSTSSSSSKDAKYLKLKEEYRKIKSKRKDRGLVT